MNLKVLGSSSKGNCYLLESDTECLIIEAGVPFKDVKVAMDFNTAKIHGVLASHEHRDHSGYVKQYIDSGIRCYSSKQAWEGLGIDHYNAIHVTPKMYFEVGNFSIIALPVHHDVYNFAYVIKHKDCGSVLFCTDTDDFNYNLTGLNHIIIEANYDIDIIDDMAIYKDMDLSLRQRTLGSHMELGRLKEIIEDMDISNVRNIVLVHLSDSNSHSKKFRNELIGLTAKDVYIAEKNLVIDFNRTAF